MVSKLGFREIGKSCNRGIPSVRTSERLPGHDARPRLPYRNIGEECFICDPHWLITGTVPTFCTVMFHKLLTHSGPTYLTAITAYYICVQGIRLTLLSPPKRSNVGPN